MAEHPYTPFIARVKKPAQYLGEEHGQRRTEWEADTTKVCLAFPDLYEVGMSHLGFRILYSIVNDQPDMLAERVYAPWTDLEAELRKRNEPLRSLENWKPLHAFDVVGFSLQFELTYTNILCMLELGGIALRSSERNHDSPLIIAGGPVATHAEPLAPFVDAFVIGDGEEVLTALARRWTELKALGVTRKKALEAISELQGVYVPSLYATHIDSDTGLQVVDAPGANSAADGHTDRDGTYAPPFPVPRAFIADLNAYPFPHDSPTGTTETVFDRSAIEIARGCTEGCRFCQAGMIYRPVREREPAQVIDTVQKAIDFGGHDEASLTCLSTADYSAVAPLIKGLTDTLTPQKVSLSLASLRAYGLAEETLDDLKRARAGGLTFAPEAGTQRMRDVINKNVTEEQLLQTAERVFSRGWEKMKLYFMIGLPTEEEDDVRGIVRTGKEALKIAAAHVGKRAQVVVSVSTHVPKPHTPFQWCAMDTHAAVRHKQKLLREESKGSRTKLRLHDAQGSWLEGVMARGDRRLADVLQTAYERGARFDSWQDQLKLDIWNDAFEEHGVRPQAYLGTLPVDARLPWDHIDVGLAPGFLAKEYRKSLRGRLSPPCGKMVGQFVHATNLAEANAEKKRLVCYDCGVACDLENMRTERKEFLTSLGALGPREPNEEKAAPVSFGAPHKKGGKRPEIYFSQGEAKRLRLVYSRVGAVSYAGHLDLVRLFPRIFRRAGIALHYTEGFHPRPALTFGPALPVGMHALAEVLDVKVDGTQLSLMQQEFDGQELVSRLNSSSVRGIVFSQCRALGLQEPGLNKRLRGAHYVCAIPTMELAEAGFRHVSEFVDRYEQANRDGEVLEVVRNVKGIKKRVRIQDYVQSIDEGGAQYLQAAGLGTHLPALQIRTEISGHGTVRPREVLQALANKEIDAQWVRAALIFEEEAGAEQALRSRIQPSIPAEGRI